MKTKTSPVSFQETVLLGLLALVPVVFSRVTQECFEIPQSALLATGALLLLWRALASELAQAARAGPGGYLSAAGARLGHWAGRDPLGAAVLLFLASAAASTVASPNPGLSLHGASDSTAGLVAACSTAIVYFTARAVSRGNPAALARFARAAGFASAVTVLYSVIQLLRLDPLVWGRTATYEGDVRIFGTLGHPNMLGAYLAMTTPLTLWLAARSKGPGGRIGWALLGAASVVVIAATLSRGAWIGFLAGALAWLALSLLARGRSGPASRQGGGQSPTRLPAAILVSLLAVAAAAFFFARSPMGPHLVERVRQIASMSAPTTQSRLYIWRAGLRMAGDHPWLGVGLDAFTTFFPRYRTVGYWRIELGGTPTKAHNEAIEILATQGLLGGAAALLVLIFVVLAIRKGVARQEGAARSGAIAVTACLVAFAVQDLASFTVVALGSLAAAAAGWLASSGGAPERGGTDPRSRRGGVPVWARALAGAPALALFVLLVLLPFRAEIEEKVAIRAPDGSPRRAAALERAARLAPWNPRYKSLLGTSLLAQAQAEPGGARDLLRRAALAERSAIAAEPQNGYYDSNLGRVLAAQATLNPPDASAEDARRAFARAMASDPTNAEIMDQASHAMIELGLHEEARAIARRTVAAYPELAQPMAVFGYIAILDKRWADAADTLELATRRQWWGEEFARATTWSNLSATYLALNRSEDALRAAEEAVRLAPSDPNARANRDLARERLGRKTP